MSQSRRALDEERRLSGQHTREALQFLSGRRQMKLFGHVPEPAELHASEPYLLFEFGEQRFDARASAVGPITAGRVQQRTDRLTGCLLSVDKESSGAP